MRKTERVAHRGGLYSTRINGCETSSGDRDEHVAIISITILSQEDETSPGNLEATKEIGDFMVEIMLKRQTKGCSVFSASLQLVPKNVPDMNALLAGAVIEYKVQAKDL